MLTKRLGFWQTRLLAENEVRLRGQEVMSLARAIVYPCPRYKHIALTVDLLRSELDPSHDHKAEPGLG